MAMIHFCFEIDSVLDLSRSDDASQQDSPFYCWMVNISDYFQNDSTKIYYDLVAYRSFCVLVMLS